ncbi:uncharacterized protein LOC108090630 [Drosophila ficusphila]|uniref:uncharacterized protein LOC108090630 n=1 Tax=Drosophila ficusphila TaxID=30025 RepID=UPI0007E82800|nr:uncharacterized protein LOC108090630 [Drosophila ficusphila]XP_017044898.1 uncharacterized protein LOC108090630 [Drosophila ficusphila]
MPSAKDKLLRKERILEFIRENRELRPINSTPVLQAPLSKKDETLRQKKRVTFIHSKQRSIGDSTRSRDNDKIIGQGLTSCLITKSSDTRLNSGGSNAAENLAEKPQADGKNPLKSSNSRMPAGANNPAERNVGTLPRTDSECQFKEPGIFFLQKVHSDFATQEVKLNSKPLRKELKNKCDFFPKYMDNRPFKDEATQTLYRESSAQTLAFLPELANQEKSETLELFTLAKLLPGDKPPGLHEVEFLERARKRWDFGKALQTNLKRRLVEARKVCVKTKYKEIFDAFEWEQWIQREEDIQECQMMRLQIVIKMFDKREKEMHAASKTRIEQSFERIDKRRRADLRKNEVEYQKGMRRISIQLAKTCRKWEKQSPMQALGSPCSEFYGPLIRHGVDPARRSFASKTERKAFDMRIDDLEKRVNMRNVQCPFSKLKEWSKPKEYDREYERNFCNDGNLQRLYESLKTLRTQQDQAKDAPLCLKTRLRIERQHSSSDSDDSYLHYNINSRKTRFTEHSVPSTLKKLQATSSAVSRQPRKSEKQRSSTIKREDLEHLISSYEGSYIGTIMQFLSNEMQRLKELRKLHFFCILAQKERWKREAAEAGLRQKENSMRMVYEEVFQHCHVVHGEVGEKYTDTIMASDIGHMIENETAEDVTEMARQIDKDIERWLESFKLIQTPLTYTPLRLMLQDMVCPDLNEVLRRYENSMIAKYIVEDVIFGEVWQELEPFDIASTLTSDLIDRLIDNDLYLFSSDSEPDSQEKMSWYESHAIIRKLIRQAVPGRRWLEETERIAIETYNGLLDDVFAEIIAKIENPPPVQSCDLVPLCKSKAYDSFGPLGPRRMFHEEPASRSDSLQQTTLLRSQFLSLIKKFRQDKVTKKLEGDEQFPEGNDDSDLPERFIKSESLVNPDVTIRRRTASDPNLHSILSTLNISEFFDNPDELRVSDKHESVEPIFAETKVTKDLELKAEAESLKLEDEVEGEIQEPEYELQDLEGDELNYSGVLYAETDHYQTTSIDDEDIEAEAEEEDKEGVVYISKDSQLFNFR